MTERRTADKDQDARRTERLDALISKLPGAWFRAALHWLLRPSAWYARIPIGLLLCLGGFFSFLPVLGIWMLPLGLILLAQDLPPLRHLIDRAMDWAERRWPQLFEHESCNARR